MKLKPRAWEKMVDFTFSNSVCFNFLANDPETSQHRDAFNARSDRHCGPPVTPSETAQLVPVNFHADPVDTR